ncbi:MAG: hypothetical protein ACI4O8_11795 [Aristaeellaceae bacterium]
MLNLILSLFVCLAMSVSGVSALPAQPETATTTVVRNVTVGLDGKSVTLNPELALTTAVGREQALTHFEIRSGDSVLLPMSLELAPDQARFSLMNSGRAYSITENALLGMLFEGAAGKEIEQLRTALNGIAELYYSEGAMMALLQDETLDDRLTDVLLENWCDVTGTLMYRTEVEVDGALCPSKSIDLHSDFNGLVAALKRTSESEDAQVALAAGVILNLINQTQSLGDLLIGELDLNNISPLALNESGEAVPLATPLGSGSQSGGVGKLEFDLDYQLVEGTEFSNEVIDMIVTDLDAVTEERTHIENRRQGDTTQISYRVHSADALTSGTETLLEYSGSITDLGANAQRVDLSYNVEYGDSGILSGAKAYRIRAFGALQGETGDASDLHFDMELQKDSDVLATLDARYAGAAGADGARTSHVELALSLLDEKDPHDLSLSFDVERSRGAVVNDLEGLTELSLNDANGEGVKRLRLELLGLTANAATLSAEESVLALQNLLDEGLPLVVNGVMQVERSTEYVNMYSADSVEDAKKIFEGRIPDFTPPEGYELDSIQVSAYSYYALYVNGDRAFYMDVDSYGMNTDGAAVHYGLLKDDGTLETASGSPVEIYLVNGAVQRAVVTREDMYIYFSFRDEGVNLNEFRAILAGLGK